MEGREGSKMEAVGIFIRKRKGEYSRISNKTNKFMNEGTRKRRIWSVLHDVETDVIHKFQ